MNERHQRTYPLYINGIFPALNFDIDDVDIPLEHPCVSNLDILFLIFSILMHIIDMVFDINIAVKYFLTNKMTYFAWTTFFIFIPSLINVIISRRMQNQDLEVNVEEDELNEYKSARIIIKNNIYCVIAVVFQLAPVVHYYDTLIYALKARKCEKKGDLNGQKKYYIKMLKEDQDVALLRVFECFIEAAPQQVLQLTILLRHYHDIINLEFIHQVCSIVSSLISMGWSMASYNQSIRLAQHNKKDISITGRILQFFWHFCITVSRILSISVIASVWPLYTAIACICHWIIMTTSIVANSHGILQFCRKNNRAPHITPTLIERICSMLFAAVIGIVHIFIHLNIVDGSTLIKHIFFYVICFLENITASLFWIFTSSIEVRNAWYFDVLITLCIAPFLLGIIAMIIYYTIFHPSRNKHLQDLPLEQN